MSLSVKVQLPYDQQVETFSFQPTDKVKDAVNKIATAISRDRVVKDFDLFTFYVPSTKDTPAQFMSQNAQLSENNNLKVQKISIFLKIISNFFLFLFYV